MAIIAMTTSNSISVKADSPFSGHFFAVFMTVQMIPG
jgi:hypothetical protein